MIKLPFILYFLDGPFTTPADLQAARELKANVAFRNGQQVPAEGSLEQCDGVAATAPYEVPARYAAAFPSAADALAKYDADIAAAAAKVGGTPVEDTAAAEAAAKAAADAAKPQAGAEQPAPEAGAEKVKAAWKPNA